MRLKWTLSTEFLSPRDRPLLVSDGYSWTTGKRLLNGAWKIKGEVEPLYWAEVELPPKPPYVAADGATIIPLQGREDVYDLIQPGDELWTSAITELSRGDKPFLIFVEMLPGAVVYHQKGVKGLFFTDWQEIRMTMHKLNRQACYLRRPYEGA